MSESSLPDGWVELTLEEFSYVNMGQSPKGANVSEARHGLPFYQGKAEFGALYPTPRKYCTVPTKIAKKGDILLSVRAPVGPTNLCPEESCIGRGLAGVRAVESASQNYLLKFFRNIEPWLSQQGTGSTFKAISGGFLREIKVPVPPLNEQTRIANKLDELLAQVDTIKARVDAIPAILKRFRQSVLAAAVSGKLTEEWRRENGAANCQSAIEDCAARRFELWEKQQLDKFLLAGNTPKNDKWKEKYNPISPDDHIPGMNVPSLWNIASLEFLSDVVSDGDHNPPKKVDSGIRHLTIRNVNHGRISFDDCAYVSEEGYKKTRERYQAQTGDVLISCIGSIGRTAIVGDDTHFSTDRNLAYARLLKVVSPKFVQIVLDSPQLQSIMSDGSGGNAQNALYLKVIRKLPIPVMSTDEQKQIVQKVEQLFAFADQIEQRIKDSQSRINNLTQSILAKAFRGELVPQDPNDEPASLLLERIKLEREAAAKLAKEANKVGSKKVKA